MLSLFVRVQNWLHDEEGDFSIGGGGTLGLIAIVLIIICAVVWLWINIDVNEK